MDKQVYYSFYLYQKWKFNALQISHLLLPIYCIIGAEKVVEPSAPSGPVYGDQTNFAAPPPPPAHYQVF